MVELSKWKFMKWGSIMPKISKQKSNQNILLAEKIQIIYDVLCHKDILELLELFTDPLKMKDNENYDYHRKKVLSRILRNQTVRFSHIEESFSRMKISKLLFGKRVLFEKKFFFDSSIDRFKKHVDAYMEYLAAQLIGIDLEYKYIYFFDHKDDNNQMIIKRYNIEYLTKKVSNCIEGVDINLSQEKSKDIYKGCIKNDLQRVVINVKNRHDNLTMLFNASLLGASNIVYFDKALYGVAIGIDDKHQKIPVAKKVVLMQNELSEKELKYLYLAINETETLEVRENLYALEPNMSLDINYLSKYREMIFNIHNFFSTLKYNSEITTHISDHMLFTEFHAFSMMYDKYAKNQNFFLNDRKRIILELLRFLDMYPTKSMMMVLPIYDKNENLFLFEAVNKVSTTELLLDRAKSGIKFEIVFVVKKPQDYIAPYMEGIFAQLNEAGVKFSFIDQKSVERKVVNLDFIYCLEHNFAIIKDHPQHKAVFTITKNSGFITSCIKDFKLLQSLSYSYEEIMEESCTLAVYDDVLLKMVGTWYGYFYSSIKDENQEPLLWETEYTVLNDCSVYSKQEKRCNSNGTIEIAEHQTLFSLVCKETKNSHYLVFDNNRINDLFQVMLYAKQYNNEEDMADAGILSKEKLPTPLVRSLLGEPEKLMLMIKPDLQKRIKEYILKKNVPTLM
jgi:hypothetical protein